MRVATPTYGRGNWVFSGSDFNTPKNGQACVPLRKRGANFRQSPSRFRKQEGFEKPSPRSPSLCRTPRKPETSSAARRAKAATFPQKYSPSKTGMPPNQSKPRISPTMSPKPAAFSSLGEAAKTPASAMIMSGAFAG